MIAVAATSTLSISPYRMEIVLKEPAQATAVKGTTDSAMALRAGGSATRFTKFPRPRAVEQETTQAVPYDTAAAAGVVVVVAVAVVGWIGGMAGQ